MVHKHFSTRKICTRRPLYKFLKVQVIPTALLRCRRFCRRGLRIPVAYRTALLGNHILLRLRLRNADRQQLSQHGRRHERNRLRTERIYHHVNNFRCRTEIIRLYLAAVKNRKRMAGRRKQHVRIIHAADKTQHQPRLDNALRHFLRNILGRGKNCLIIIFFRSFSIMPQKPVTAMLSIVYPL